MSWMQFSHGLRRGRIAKRTPEALVVLLHDRGTSAAALGAVAARWATTVPTTVFTALDGIDQLDRAPSGFSYTSPALADGADPMLDRAARNLEALLSHQLSSHRLDASRLVLVGFGYGGTLALHLLLRQGWSCAGILAIAAQLARPLPRVLRIDCKVRLIGCAADAQADHGSLRDDVALLAARGVDARGVVLVGSPLSDEIIRHAGAYLVELVATAQRGDRFHVDRESSHA
jgi:pimeloyl-ACP methyl ester carboxylesterase